MSSRFGFSSGGGRGFGAGSGHWAILGPIAERLVEAGHEVFAALRNVDVVCGHWPPQWPLTVLQAPYLSAPSTLQIRDVHSLAHILDNVGYHSSESLRSLVSSWRNMYALIQPDILVLEHSPTALLAARESEYRRIVPGTGFTVPLDTFPLSELQPWRPAPGEELLQDETRVLARVNEVLRKDGVAELAQLSRLYRDVDESFLMTFPELDHYGRRSDDHYWGVFPSDGKAFVDWLPGSSRKRIFAYLKVFPALPVLLQELARPEYDVIAYLPDCSAERKASYARPSLRFVDKPLNLSLVAQGCDLALLNATANTVANLLLLGVPSLNFPLYVEQALVAYRLAKTNLGATCQIDQPHSFGPALAGVLGETRFTAAAGEFARRYEKFDAEAAVEGVVERVVKLL